MLGPLTIGILVNTKETGVSSLVSLGNIADIMLLTLS